MASRYIEHAPGLLESTRVECVWTMQSGDRIQSQRVLPDGCVDILYTRDAAGSQLNIIGAMTAYRDYSLSPRQLTMGVRFRPGGCAGLIAVPCSEWTDQSVELASISPRDARLLKQRLDDDPSAANLRQLSAVMLAKLPPPDVVQKAIRHLTETNGDADLEWVASQANVSDRQFRRLCRARTGLNPKQLARVLRFRRAHALCSTTLMSLTEVALECGYFDQAHFIHDFQLWCGATPSAVRQTAGPA